MAPPEIPDLQLVAVNGQAVRLWFEWRSRFFETASAGDRDGIRTVEGVDRFGWAIHLAGGRTEAARYWLPDLKPDPFNDLWREPDQLPGLPLPDGLPMPENPRKGESVCRIRRLPLENIMVGWVVGYARKAEGFYGPASRHSYPDGDYDGPYWGGQKSHLLTEIVFPSWPPGGKARLILADPIDYATIVDAEIVDDQREPD